MYSLATMSEAYQMHTLKTETLQRLTTVYPVTRQPGRSVRHNLTEKRVHVVIQGTTNPRMFF